MGKFAHIPITILLVIIAILVMGCGSSSDDVADTPPEPDTATISESKGFALAHRENIAEPLLPHVLDAWAIVQECAGVSIKPDRQVTIEFINAELLDAGVRGQANIDHYHIWVVERDLIEGMGTLRHELAHIMLDMLEVPLFTNRAHDSKIFECVEIEWQDFPFNYTLPG